MSDGFAYQVRARLTDLSSHDFSERPWATTAVLFVLTYSLLHTLYRFLVPFYYQHFHALAGFSGPEEAISSRQWVHRLLASGKAEETFERLHEKYRVSALRVGPNELHINDVSAYRSIYRFKTPYLKDPPFYDGVLTPHTLFAETDNGLHHQRRKQLDNVFSKRAVNQLEPVIGEKIKILAKKLRTIGPGKPVNIYNAFRCMTLDIIRTWSFGHDSDIISESRSDFTYKLFEAFDTASPGLVDMQESWVKRFLASKIPLSILASFDENLKEIYKMQQESLQGLRVYKRMSERPAYPVILDSMQDLSDQDQAMQAIEIILGGTDTSAFTLSMGIFRILSSPECTKKLVASLDEHISEPGTMMPLVELEKIDYLWAVVKECLRVAMPIRGRLPRIVPQDAPPLVVDGKTIPPGTVVGMSAHTMNSSPEIWGTDAKVFRPERWISPDGTRDPDQLGQYLGTFSRGVRQCIGRNLAEAEVTIALAYFFRTFTMTLKTEHVDIVERFTTFLTEDIMVDFVERTG